MAADSAYDKVYGETDYGSLSASDRYAQLNGDNAKKSASFKSQSKAMKEARKQNSEENKNRRENMTATEKVADATDSVSKEHIEHRGQTAVKQAKDAGVDVADLNGSDISMSDLSFKEYNASNKYTAEGLIKGMMEEGMSRQEIEASLEKRGFKDPKGNIKSALDKNFGTTDDSKSDSNKDNKSDSNKDNKSGSNKDNIKKTGKDEDKKDDKKIENPPKVEDLPQEIQTFLNVELSNGQPFATYDPETGKIKLAGLPDKNEFMKNAGAKGWMNRLEGVFDMLGAAGALFGLPAIPVGSIVNDIAQNNVDDAYDALVKQYNQVEDAFSGAIGTAAGNVVSGRGERSKDKESANDDAWLNAKTKLADAQGDWNKLEQEDLLTFNNQLTKEIAKYNNDLAKDYQSFFSGLQLNQQRELLQIMAQGDINKINMFMDQVDSDAWGKFQKEMDENSHYSGGFKGFMEGAKDVMGVGGGFVGAVAKGIVNSDKRMKSFVMPKMFH